MASHVYVVDSTARRTQIKTTPGRHLRDVLEEACQKLKLNSDNYTLKNNNKPVDLSLTVRLSGIASGAKLQLTQASRSPAVVSVALSLPSSEGGARLTDRFPSSTSLWLVLRKFEDAIAGDPPKKLNLTQRGVPSSTSGAGKLEYEQPVINAMGRDLGSFLDLQKTLQQLGYNSGSVMLRLTYKQQGVPMEEAMAQISGYFAAVDATTTSPSGTSQETRVAHGVHANADATMTSLPDADADNAAVPAEGNADKDPSGDTIMTPPPTIPIQRAPADDTVLASSSITAQGGNMAESEAVSQPAPTEASQASSLATDPTRLPPPSASTQQQPSQIDTSPLPSAERAPATTGLHFSVYAPSSNPTPLAARTPTSTADFEPSVEHAHAHQALLSRLSQNRRLASDAELASLAADRQAALSTISTSTLRLRFPDQMLVDLTISQSDTPASLYATVSDMLERPSEPFSLRYVGPKGAAVVLDRRLDGVKDGLIKGAGFSGRVLVTMVWDAPASDEARSGPVLKPGLRDVATELKVPVPESVAEPVGAKIEAAKTSKKETGKSKGDVEARMKKFLGFGKK